MQYIEGFRCLNLAAQRGSNRSLERLLHKHLYSQESKSTSASDPMTDMLVKTMTMINM